jgi:small-conductance mechanosensitive channel
VNPMLAKKLEELETVADDLRAAFAAAAATAEKHLEEREETQQELWRHQKDLAGLKRLADDYNNLSDANERYRSQRDQVRQGLERILSHAKALGLEYQQ